VLQLQYCRIVVQEVGQQGPHHKILVTRITQRLL
jgi:hypothetical protein